MAVNRISLEEMVQKIENECGVTVRRLASLCHSIGNKYGYDVELKFDQKNTPICVKAVDPLRPLKN